VDVAFDDTNATTPREWLDPSCDWAVWAAWPMGALRDRAFTFTAPRQGLYVFAGSSNDSWEGGPAIGVLDGICGGDERVCRLRNYSSVMSHDSGTPPETRATALLDEGQTATVVVQGDASSYHLGVACRACPNFDWNTGEDLNGRCAGDDSSFIDVPCDSARTQQIIRYTATVTGDHRFHAVLIGYLAFIEGDRCTGEIFQCAEGEAASWRGNPHCEDVEAVLPLVEGETILVVVGESTAWDYPDCEPGLTIDPMGG
jgi:hypothetical protein